MPTPKKLANVFRVVTLVQADVLASAGSWLRAFNRKAIKGCFKKFNVVRVSAAYFDAQRHAVAIGEHRLLGSQFAMICRVFPGFFPHPEAIWSSLRPRFANSIGCLLVRRTPAARLSIIYGRRQVPSIPGSDGARCSPNHTRAALLSTGSLCATRRKFRWQPFSSRHAADAFTALAIAGQQRLHPLPKRFGKTPSASVQSFCHIKHLHAKKRWVIRHSLYGGR